MILVSALVGIIVLLLLVLFFWRSRTKQSRRALAPRLLRVENNPVLKPLPEHPWENEAVFNPAAIYENGRVHLLYRALGSDGVSRIGYASSADGIHFDERLAEPVFVPEFAVPQKFHNPLRPSPELLRYDPYRYASGGGWNGCEDPRAVSIEGTAYMTFGFFENWQSMRLGITSIPLEELLSHQWHKWAPYFLISPEKQTHKNWVLFPEKIHGRFAILHALTPRVLIAYVDSLDTLRQHPIKSNNQRGGRTGAWDSFVRGCAAPPLKTKHGWLLLYHGMNPAEPAIGYKVGAMLLDLDDPSKVLYRSSRPILEPKMPYEHDWKPGVVYASGAVIKDGTLFVYYGGGDKTISVATAPLERFLTRLMHHSHATLSEVKV